MLLFMKQTKNSHSVLILATLTLFIFIFVFFLYTFLHEAGHALAGWLFGQSLTEFDVSFWDMSAHVGLAGGDLTQSQLAIQSAAGTLLPLLTWAIFISLVARKGSFILEELKLLSSMLVVNTLLTWILIPMLFILGKAPSDDVTNFLTYSQMPPLLLSSLAILLYMGGWMLFLSKIYGFRDELRMFRTKDDKILKEGIRRTIPVMAGIIAFCVILVFALGNSAAKNSSSKFLPPQNFTLAAQIDLSTGPYSSETIAQFTLEQPSYAGVFIVIHNIDTTFFDLSVLKPDGTREVVLHGEGYGADQDGGLWKKTLSPGLYRLVLTSHQSSGTASIFLNTSNP